MAYFARPIINGVYQGTDWTPNANTKAYWKLNGDLLDYSGNNNHLKNTPVTGGTVSTKAPIIGSGKFGNSYYFENSLRNLLWTDIVPITESEKNNCTHSVWFKPTTNVSGAVVFLNGSNYGFLLRNGDGSIQPGLLNVANLPNLASWPDTWVNVVWTQLADESIAYINGLSGSTYSGTPGTPNLYFQIGGTIVEDFPEWSYAGFYSGYVCEMIVENVAWSAEAVLAYYNKYK